MKRRTVILLAFLAYLNVAAQPANQNVSGGLVFEGEPFLAVDPSDPQHLVVSWIGYVFQHPSGIKTRASFDGGQSWSPIVILPHFRSTYKSADPSMVFDVNGDVLACYVDYRQNPDSGGVFVVRSTDGGLSWGGMSQVIDGYDDGQELPVDRPWLAIDRSGGSFDGRLYVTTKPAPWVPAPNRPYRMHSSDGGVTWSPWQYVDTTGYLVGNFIAAPMAVSAVAANGRWDILYPSYVPSQNVFPGYLLASSVDGGSSFSYQEAWFGAVNANDSLIKGGYELLSDPSDANHLVIVTPQNLQGDQDIYCLQSHDAGTTWTAPVRVNDDAPATGVTQDLAWAGFDTDGDLVVTWRDRRNAIGSGYQVASEIWGSVLWADSTTFSPNFPISDTLAAWNAILTQSGNDFMCSRMVNDTLFAVWGDTRNGRLNIYFVKFDLRSLVVTGIHPIGSEVSPDIRVYPIPCRDVLHVDGEGIRSMELTDMAGMIVRHASATPLNLEGLSPGIYVLKVESESGEFEMQILKTKD